MRYFIVLDMPDTTYPVSDPFYAPDGKDPFGRSSLAGWIVSTDRALATAYVDAFHKVMGNRKELLDAGLGRAQSS